MCYSLRGSVWCYISRAYPMRFSFSTFLYRPRRGAHLFWFLVWICIFKCPNCRTMLGAAQYGAIFPGPIWEGLSFLRASSPPPRYGWEVERYRWRTRACPYNVTWVGWSRTKKLFRKRAGFNGVYWLGWGVEVFILFLIFIRALVSPWCHYFTLRFKEGGGVI